jgi:hypothetical protein
VEIRQAMVERDRRNYPVLEFIQADPEDLNLNEIFDYVLFNHIFDTFDILRALLQIRRHCTPQTRLVVINYNQLWQPILELASELGLRTRFVEPNWVSEYDVRGFLNLAGFRAIRTHRLILLPKMIPLFSGLLNEYVARLPGLRRLSDADHRVSSRARAGTCLEAGPTHRSRGSHRKPRNKNACFDRPCYFGVFRERRRIEGQDIGAIPQLAIIVSARGIVRIHDRTGRIG